ncbi:hypothetical protein CIL05_07605 [Virgibacillus profundi]|uniref:(d)CMP kinase n=1 Tax=Virgibacillus profundi TaxID=2024555 RepID=A0A2A2IF97_9BACI|nr:deoxynucleoside kinase [Virgibacillus profundi]PAV30327.1 hypothetical protein CIL05_07605 [Virgibacillus profundi]PXY54499.1 hypothetical protein CIT14_07690 [Virgibacillus profundi]
MNILIDGVDASGKSTVAHKLSDKLNMLEVRGSSFELADCTNEELYKHFTKVANLDNAIIQRGIYSNRTYATLYQDYAILSHEQRTTIEDKFKDNTVVIYLTAPEETIINRLEERGDDYVTTDKVSSILGLYKTVMTDAISNSVAVLTYDTSKLSSDEIVEDIIKVIQEPEEHLSDE